MSDYGADFVTLQNSSDHDIALHDALRELPSVGDRKFGTLYIPKGRWRFGASGTQEIPADVTVRLAPGAVIAPLLPAAWVQSWTGVFQHLPEYIVPPSLRVLGRWIAPSSTVISTPALDVAVADPRVPVPESYGWVSLLDPGLEVVRTEWWGGGELYGGRSNPEVDSAALEAALRVATRRLRWSEDQGPVRVLARLSPPAVEVGRPLVLARPLVIEARARPLALADGRVVSVEPTLRGLVLRGACVNGPDLTLDPQTADPPAMLLDVRAVDGVMLQRLSLDARDVTCLRIRPDRDAAPGVLDVTDCSFRSAGLTLVSVLSWPDVTSPAVASPSVVFQGCVWHPSVVPGGGSALRVDMHDRSVAVRGGQFVGATHAMVSLVGGNLTVDHCTFSNTWAGVFPPYGIGVDVVLAGALSCDSELSITSCTSRSWRVLSSLADDGLSPRRARVVTVKSLVHRPEGRSRPLLPDVAPIEWADGGRPDSRLVLNGGQLTSAPIGGVTLLQYGRVAVEISTPGAVIDAWVGPDGRDRFVGVTGRPAVVSSLDGAQRQ